MTVRRVSRAPLGRMRFRPLAAKHAGFRQEGHPEVGVAAVAKATSLLFLCLLCVSLRFAPVPRSSLSFAFCASAPLGTCAAWACPARATPGMLSPLHLHCGVRVSAQLRYVGTQTEAGELLRRFSGGEYWRPPSIVGGVEVRWPCLALPDIACPDPGGASRASWRTDRRVTNAANIRLHEDPAAGRENGARLGASYGESERFPHCTRLTAVTACASDRSTAMHCGSRGMSAQALSGPKCLACEGIETGPMPLRDGQSLPAHPGEGLRQNACPSSWGSRAVGAGAEARRPIDIPPARCGRGARRIKKWGPGSLVIKSWSLFGVILVDLDLASVSKRAGVSCLLCLPRGF